MLVFDLLGNPFPACSSELIRRFPRLPITTDVIAYAVRELGHVYIGRYRDALVIEFQPEIVSHLALIAAFYAIADRAPERLVLALRGQPDRFEILHGVRRALTRIEALVTECSGTAGGRWPLQRERAALNRLSDIGGRSFVAMFRAWNNADGWWSRPLVDSLHRAGLLEYCALARNPKGSERLVRDSPGTGAPLFGQRWRKAAIGRDIEDQPDSRFGAWIAAAYREALASGEPRLEKVAAVIHPTSGRRFGCAKYSRLILPWRSREGDNFVSSIVVRQ
jgi:hypothetical protein